MAKKKKKSKAAEESSAFDAIDVKNQGQMLDYLKDALNVRSKLTTEERESLNISKQLQKMGQQVLASQNAGADAVRKEKDIKKDILLSAQTIFKLEKETKLLKDATSKKDKDRLKVAQDQLGIAQKLNQELEKEKTKRKDIDAKTGSLGTALKGISQIPILGDMLDTNEAMKEMEDAAAGGASQIGVMGAGLKTLGAQLKKHMTDPFVWIIAAIKAGFEFDKQVTALGKGLGVSREEAGIMRNHFTDLARSNGEMAITSTEMAAGFNMVNNALGTSSTVIRDDIVLEAGRMQKLMGMSEESIAGFASHALRSGKDMKQIKLEAIGQVKAMEAEHGARLDIKKVLEEAGKIQGQISAQMGGDPARIAGAVAKAQELGMTLEGVAAAGKTMLNFEESISAELEAELLTGKQLNLEKARLAALTGDYETLTEEINENVGDFGDFSKMNVLQQEALAKSVGMTADQLSNQLMKKADLKALAQEARDNNDEETAQMLEQRAAQEEFNDLIVQLKTTFLDLVGGPVGEFLSGMAAVAGFFGEIFMTAGMIGKAIGDFISPLTGLLNKMGILGKILKGVAWFYIIKAAFASFTSLASRGPLGVVAGIAASVGILAAGNAALNKKKADDFADVPGAGGGYGKRALMEKGSVTLFNDKDTIIAGTNLTGRKANDATFTPEGTNTNIASGGEGGGQQPLQVNVTAQQQNDVFARTDKNSENVYMVQTKSDGLFA